MRLNLFLQCKEVMLIFFSVAEQIDSKYAQLFRQAIKKGLIVTPVVVSLDQTHAVLTDRILKVINFD